MKVIRCLTCLALLASMGAVAQQDPTKSNGWKNTPPPPGVAATSAGSAAAGTDTVSVQHSNAGGGGGVGFATATPPPGGGGGGGGGFGMAMPPSAGGGGGGMLGVAPPPGGQFSSRLQSIIARASGPAGGPLIIRNSEAEPSELANLEEDMQIMAHILEKAAAEAGNSPNRAMGVDLYYVPGTESKRDMYVEGYGMIFMLQVPFPLAKLGSNADTPEQKGGASSEWESAKRELRGQAPDPFTGASASEPYQEQRVARLQEALIDVAKNASHIRGLKPEDSIVICVVGPGGAGASMPKRPLPARTLKTAQGEVYGAAGFGARSSATMMTLRFSKRDVDAFASGKLAAANFRENSKILVY